jgi:two-component system sensor histidine kinase DegS
MDKTRVELKELKELVRCSLREIRKIIFDLRPMSLDDLGLIPTIQRYLANYRTDTSIEVALHYNNEIIETKGIIDVALFRIMQEALNNVKKYSKADKVCIMIDNDGEVVTMKIKDNGIGFDVDEVLKGINLSDDMKGFGLHSMRQRVELLNGSFEIVSVADKGTEITVKIPINSSKGVEQHE